MLFEGRFRIERDETGLGSSLVVSAAQTSALPSAA